MLTKRQGELLAYLAEQVQDHGLIPAYDQMAKALGIASKSGVHRMVLALEERGFIRRIPHRARAIEIIKTPKTEATDDSWAVSAAKTLSVEVLEAIINEKRAAA